MNILGNFLNSALSKSVELERCQAKAEAMGYTIDEVMDMGILCAQLGLTPETLYDAARLYVKSLQ